jgi:hypothetical protein
VVDGDRTKVAIDTNKIEWPVPGCQRGQKCTIDASKWTRNLPRIPKPPAPPPLPSQHQ